MKVLFLSVLCIFSFSSSFSQTKGNYKISGTIIDSVSKQPVEYATISIIDNITKKIVDDTISNKQGKFQLKKITAGNYSMSIQCIGYTDLFIKVSVTADVLLNDIILIKEREKIS